MDEIEIEMKRVADINRRLESHCRLLLTMLKSCDCDLDEEDKDIIDSIEKFLAFGV